MSPGALCGCIAHLTCLLLAQSCGASFDVQIAVWGADFGAGLLKLEQAC